MANKEYFIIFGGGGIRGLSYCGAFKALLENDIKITGCAGSSIGAVFASLWAVGYSYDEIFEILADTGFEMFIDINIDLKKELAFSKGKIFYDWIKEKIEQKFYFDHYKKEKMPPVRFCDIKNNLIIYSVDLTNLKFHEFSKQKTPDFEIAKAVRASVSMPGLFTPVEVEGNLIVDGDLLKSAPLWRLCDTIKNSKDKIIEFRLEDNETPKKITNSIEYVNRVYNAFCGFATDYIIDLYKEKDRFDYIKINTQDVSVVDFLISKEKKKELYDTGYIKTKEYFKQYFPKKEKMLLKKYEILVNKLMKFQEAFNNSNYAKSYLRLCEIFMFLCEEKKYLDSKIYEMFLDFKNEFIKNYKDVNFFGFKKAEVDNKHELTRMMLEIIHVLASKTQELGLN